MYMYYMYMYHMYTSYMCYIHVVAHVPPCTHVHPHTVYIHMYSTYMRLCTTCKLYYYYSCVQFKPCQGQFSKSLLSIRGVNNLQTPIFTCFTM